MPHTIDDPALGPTPWRPGGRLASRRMLMALTAAALAIRPLADGQAHGRAELPPPEASPALLAGYAKRLTEARAQAEWAHFKARFIQSDGRVTDNGNAGISHSEGQGIALLCAAHFDEPDTFARILRWTRSALGRSEDHLLAWCHRPHDEGRPGDRNSATDGDLLVAWALAEAAQKWQEPTHRDLAVAMARDILQQSVVDGGAGPLLLPGSTGFQQADSITINPSYYVYPAFQALSRLHADREWAGLEEAGMAMANAARFGRWGLVPDWASVPRGGGVMSVAQHQPPRFSYDAVRVPLYLAWGGHGSAPAVGAAVRFWRDPVFARMPAWADLQTNETSPYAADSGIAGVAQVAAIASRPGTLPVQVNTAILSPTYYAAALRLMAVLALRAMPMASLTIPAVLAAPVQPVAQGRNAYLVHQAAVH